MIKTFKILVEKKDTFEKFSKPKLKYEKTKDVKKPYPIHSNVISDLNANDSISEMNELLSTEMENFSLVDTGKR